ncbi:MAG: methyltransferase domain-containing protein, partial [Chloroflexi bacterium]|nr:methyltransferase domain-containing protein [Chloroflexota bacterium]
MTQAEYRRRRREEWDAAGRGYAILGAELKELLGPVTERILDLADLRLGERVLDIATGPGSPALEAAQRVGSGGRVVGVDFAPSMLEVASRRAIETRVDNVQFLGMDAERLAIRDETFDVVLSRYGFPHCADAVMALREACRVLRPGGHLVAGHHGRPERNPYLSLPVRMLSRYRDGTAASASESAP